MRAETSSAPETDRTVEPPRVRGDRNDDAREAGEAGREDAPQTQADPEADPEAGPEAASEDLNVADQDVADSVQPDRIAPSPAAGSKDPPIDAAETDPSEDALPLEPEPVQPANDDGQSDDASTTEEPTEGPTEGPTATPEVGSHDADLDAADEAASAATTATPAEARYRGRVVHVFRVPLGRQSPDARAKEAVHNLEQVLSEPLKDGAKDQVSVRQRGDVAVITVGDRKILSLGPEDAKAAGHPDVAAYAEEVRNETADFLAAERSRKAIAGQVLSWSLVVFFGLVVVLLVPRVHRSAHQGRDWVRSHGERMPTLTVRGTELVSKGMVLNLVVLAVSALALVLQFALIYVYITVSLGLFDHTRGWVPEINQFLASPFRTLIDRLTHVFPTATLTLAIVLLLIPAYRIVGQIFDGIAEGEIEWRTVPRYLALPLKHLFLIVLVIASLLVFGPLVSDDPDSLLSRLGTMALVVVGIALVPLAATFVWGVTAVLGRTHRRGAWFEAHGHSGTVDDVTLLELIVRVEDDTETQYVRHRIPHLWRAFHPSIVAPKRPPMQLRFPIARERHRAATAQQLIRAAQKVHPDARVVLEAVEPESVVYTVFVPRDGRAGKSEVLSALVAATQENAAAKDGEPPE